MQSAIRTPRRHSFAWLAAGLCSCLLAPGDVSGDEVLAPPSESAGGSFGAAMAFDGKTLVIGAESTDSKGAAYVFEWNGEEGAWEYAQELIDEDAAIYDFFGHAVAVSGDLILVSAYVADGAHTNTG